MKLKCKLKFAALILGKMFIMGKAYPASTGTLTLTGTVSPVLNIIVNPNTIATTLDLTTTQTDLVVASVTEQSNSNTGYKITLSSANNSNLKRSGGTELKAYTLKYNGTTVGLGSSSSTPIVAKTVSSGVPVTNTSNVSISYTGQAASSMVAGTYSDVITLAIQAN